MSHHPGAPGVNPRSYQPNITGGKHLGRSSTPRKINIWNLKSHQIQKENHLPSTSIFGFKMLIFQGVWTSRVFTRISYPSPETNRKFSPWKFGRPKKFFHGNLPTQTGCLSFRDWYSFGISPRAPERFKPPILTHLAVINPYEKQHRGENAGPVDGKKTI